MVQALFSCLQVNLCNNFPHFADEATEALRPLRLAGGEASPADVFSTPATNTNTQDKHQQVMPFSLAPDFPSIKRR